MATSLLIPTMVAAQSLSGLPRGFSPGSPSLQTDFDPYVAQQQPSIGQPSFGPNLGQPGFGPQPSLVVPGPALPPTADVVVPASPVETLPVFAAGIPVRFVLSGEFLYLRASNAAMTNFAVPVNGAVVPPPTPAVPLGAVGAVEYDFDPGFRVGLDWVWNEYSRWVATYTQLRLDDREALSIDPTSPLAIQSLVMHPSTAAADALYLDATGTGRIDLRLADIEYRRVYIEDWYRWDFLVGARYAHLDQNFLAVFSNTTTTETIEADTDFDGGGIRFGTRGDWRSSRHGFFIYASANTSFVAGRFSSSYRQDDSLLGTIVFTSRKDDRIINISEAELGFGWRSPTRRWWFSGGYQFNTWSDIVSNAGLIRAVQGTSFFPIRDRLTLDGVVARAELRF